MFDFNKATKYNIIEEDFSNNSLIPLSTVFINYLNDVYNVDHITSKQVLDLYIEELTNITDNQEIINDLISRYNISDEMYNEFIEILEESALEVRIQLLHDCDVEDDEADDLEEYVNESFGNKPYSCKHFYVGLKVLIINMDDDHGKDPSARKYNGRTGIIQHIDDIGQLFGTWGGLALNPEVDTIEAIYDDDDIEDVDENLNIFDVNNDINEKKKVKRKKKTKKSSKRNSYGNGYGYGYYPMPMRMMMPGMGMHGPTGPFGPGPMSPGPGMDMGGGCACDCGGDAGGGM